MTAASGPFWKATTKPWNYPYGVFLVSSWLIGSGFYKKIKDHTPQITHHTSHIPRKITICLMYDFFQFRYKIKCDKKSENMCSSGFLIRLTVGSRILRRKKKKSNLKKKSILNFINIAKIMIFRIFKILLKVILNKLTIVFFYEHYRI